MKDEGEKAAFDLGLHNIHPEIIKLLGHPVRLKIVEVLEGGEATVTDIQEQVELEQAIVDHLKEGA